MILLVAMLVAAVIGIRIGMSRRNEALPPTHPATQTADVDPGKKAMIDAAVAKAEASITPEDHALRAFLGRFLGARAWMDFLPLVRNPDTAAPRLEAYYRDNPIKPYENVAISTEATKVGKLIVLTLTGKNLPNHRLILEKRDGGYRVDWESFVIWQEAPWKSLATGERTIPTEIRCLARPVPNHHPSFRSDGWIAYELLNPATKEMIFAYLEKKENLSEGSPRATLTSGAEGPCTLSIKPSAADGDPVLVIDEVLALGWVYPMPE